jgi:hypothetical protein
MKTLSLESLLAGLEKDAGIEKAASAVTIHKPNVSAELAGILEKKATEDITSAAFAAGEALATELLTKLAAENAIQKDNDAIVVSDDKKIVPNGTGTVTEVQMNTLDNALALGATSPDNVDKLEDKAGQTKEAQTKLENQEMAKSIMQKIAQEVGLATTTPAAAVNVEGAVAPNLIQSHNAEMTAQDDAKVLPLPGAEGTLNSILEAVVARAEAQGGVSDDLVNGDAPASSADGVGKTETDEQEKAAAVSALVEAGCNFDEAVSMVKKAEEDLAKEADQQEKVAAVNTLIEAGYDWDSAIAMVKQAEAEIAAEEAATPSRDQEKQAAFSALLEAGIDFDAALEMVKQAEQDVYGK